MKRAPFLPETDTSWDQRDAAQILFSFIRFEEHVRTASRGTRNTQCQHLDPRPLFLRLSFFTFDFAMREKEIVKPSTAPRPLARFSRRRDYYFLRIAAGIFVLVVVRHLLLTTYTKAQRSRLDGFQKL